MVSLADVHASELVVKPDVAIKQMDAERAALSPAGVISASLGDVGTVSTTLDIPPPLVAEKPKRFHGTAVLDTTRVGRDASRIAEEVISHLSGLVGSIVTVTIEVEARIPNGAPDHIVRTVTENSRTLKFTSQGFEQE